MINQKYLLEAIKNLSKFNRGIRNCIKDNQPFLEHKCRLRLEQRTRWSSDLLLLLSNKRAYDKKG